MEEEKVEGNYSLPGGPEQKLDLGVTEEEEGQQEAGGDPDRDPRPHLNVVFCGHVDCGKSTLIGHILADLGAVSKRELEKHSGAKDKNFRNDDGGGTRDPSAAPPAPQAYSNVMDISPDEQLKGKTHETGKAYVETQHRRLTVLDAPGHRAFTSSMIGAGAAQADVAVLVVSARKGEFEAGFERGGQTREHVLLCRACGVGQMICAINKLDLVGWAQERYMDIRSKLEPFLKQNGFATTNGRKKAAGGGSGSSTEEGGNLTFVPLSGLAGINMLSTIANPADLQAWYPSSTSPCLMDLINTLSLPDRTAAEEGLGLVLPIAGAYKDEGKVYLHGKLEAGSVRPGDVVTLLPGGGESSNSGPPVTVESILTIRQDDEGEDLTLRLARAYQGDNVHLVVRGVDAAQVHPGFVLVSRSPAGGPRVAPTAGEGSTTPPPPPSSTLSIKAVDYFQARLVLLDTTSGGSLITAGSRFVVHLGVAEEEVVVHKLLAKVDPKSTELRVLEKEPLFARSREHVVARLELTPRALVMGQYADFPKLGRFILRLDGSTVAIGLVTKLYETKRGEDNSGNKFSKKEGPQESKEGQ